MKKVIETIWFSGRDVVGIVCTENDMGERNFYAGVGRGESVQFDEEVIADWGVKLDPDILNRFFERNKKKEET